MRGCSPFVILKYFSLSFGATFENLPLNQTNPSSLSLAFRSLLKVTCLKSNLGCYVTTSSRVVKERGVDNSFPGVWFSSIFFKRVFNCLRQYILDGSGIKERIFKWNWINHDCQHSAKKLSTKENLIYCLHNPGKIFYFVITISVTREIAKISSIVDLILVAL